MNQQCIGKQGPVSRPIHPPLIATQRGTALVPKCPLALQQTCSDRMVLDIPSIKDSQYAQTGDRVDRKHRMIASCLPRSVLTAAAPPSDPQRYLAVLSLPAEADTSDRVDSWICSVSADFSAARSLDTNAFTTALCSRDTLTTVLSLSESAWWIRHT